MGLRKTSYACASRDSSQAVANSSRAAVFGRLENPTAEPLAARGGLGGSRGSSDLGDPRGLGDPGAP